MDLQINKIYLSIEKQAPQPEFINTEDENTDVIVEMINGEFYIASFFTFKNVGKLQKEHQAKGDYLNGKYFWVDRMLLIESISISVVDEVVRHLVEEGDFEKVFQKI